ncbi:MAG TPA: phasin family protein [Cellvibrionaceae bacterium]
MYQQFLDQAGTLFKPLHDLVSLNQSAFETFTNKQSALASEIFNDSIAFTQKVLAERDGNYWDLHKAYWEGLNQKLNQATQDTADYFAVTQTKMSDMVQESLLGNAIVQVTKNMPSVDAAVASALKPMETAKVVKPAAEAAKVPAVTPPQAPPLSPKASKSAAEKTPASTPLAKAVAKVVDPIAAEAKPAEKAAAATSAATKTVGSQKTTGKKVSGDDATVETVIRSIMAERNN